MSEKSYSELLSNLLPNHQKFVLEMFKCEFNQTQAILNAGYLKESKAKNKTAIACKMGSELMTRLDISDCIKAGRAETLKGAKLTVEKVLEGLEYVAMESRANGDMKALTRALELQGKYLAMFTEKHQVESNVRHETIEDYLKRISKKD